MKTHTLKTDAAVFKAVQRGDKTFEIRKNDRDFQEGDTLILLETEYTGEQMKSEPRNFPLIYTGEACAKRVTHIVRGPIYGLADGWVIMSLA